MTMMIAIVVVMVMLMTMVVHSVFCASAQNPRGFQLPHNALCEKAKHPRQEQLVSNNPNCAEKFRVVGNVQRLRPILKKKEERKILQQLAGKHTSIPERCRPCVIRKHQVVAPQSRARGQPTQSRNTVPTTDFQLARSL